MSCWRPCDHLKPASADLFALANKLENSCLVWIQSKNRDKKGQINVHKCGHTLAHADTHIIDDDGVSIISDSLIVSFQVKITSFPQSETFTPECSTHTEACKPYNTHSHRLLIKVFISMLMLYKVLEVTTASVHIPHLGDVVGNTQHLALHVAANELITRRKCVFQKAFYK